MSRSTLVMVLMCVLGFGLVCIGSLVRVQLVKGAEYRDKAAQNQLHDTVVAAERGVIYDANMTPLAASTSAGKVYVNPSLIGDNEFAREMIVKNLAELLGVSESSVREKCSRTGYKYMVIKDKVEDEDEEKVRNLMKTYFIIKNKDGEERKIYYNYYIGIDPDVKRYYSNPFLASTVLGFINQDYEGAYGIEQKYNAVLTGLPGRIISAKTAGGRNMPVKYENKHDAQPGTGLVLTIDEYIQSYLEKSLEQAYLNTKCDSILGIIMDTKTGAILGMGSRGIGYFDLSDPWGIVREQERLEIEAIEDEAKRREAREKVQYAQWRNPAINDTYEPGSVFKVITAAALLEEGLVPLEERFTCTGNVTAAGSRYNCHKHGGHGSQNLSDAIMNSCNPFFITRGIRLGIDGFNKYFQAFGFLEKTNIDLPAEASSIYYNISKMILANVASASFGQTFQVTPIQMLTAVNAIANGGYLMQPYLVKKQLDAQGAIITETKPTVRRQVISKETSEIMCGFMERVVNEGTGKNAYIAGYRVAGKTGTSEKVPQATASGISKTFWASFACFAPANDAKVSMIVILDNPKGAHGGGAVAAPVAAEVLSSVLEYLNVEPQYTEKELEELKIEVAEVVGKSLSDAQKELDGKRFTVKVKGGGDKVVSQIPAGGQSVPKNGVVILYTSEESKSDKVIMPDLSGLSIRDATQKAAAAGINVNITCNSELSGELLSYKQSVAQGKEIAPGTVVTVYFKSNMGITDYDE